MKTKHLKTRFAPSPTGFLHIGSARSAFFNYLFAKKNNGSFVLRIEDTDKERSKPEFEKDITQGLRWLGIEWDGDIRRQSEQTNIYKKYLQNLLDQRKAYYCFCPKEELKLKKDYQAATGQIQHNGKCMNLSKNQIDAYLNEGRPHIIRLHIPIKKVIFNDLIRGKIEFDTSLLDDFPLAKNLESPLYNFAVVIDDFETGITHLIRGEDHISNTPKQILIQEALGLPQPKYAHLPLILGPDKSKLSKRHGAASVNEFKNLGYLPEALINFIAFLGWNPGTDKEIFSLSELIKEFSLEKCQKGGAVFNIEKLNWLNGFYIRKKTIDELTELCLPYLKNLIKKTETGDYEIKETGKIISRKKIEKMIAIYQKRLKLISEIPELLNFFFKDELDYEKELLIWKGMTDTEIKDSLERSEKILSEISSWKKEDLQIALVKEAEKFAKDRGRLLWPLRVALTGQKRSATPFEVAEILEKEETLKRIKRAKQKCV